MSNLYDDLTARGYYRTDLYRGTSLDLSTMEAVDTVSGRIIFSDGNGESDVAYLSPKRYRAANERSAKASVLNLLGRYRAYYERTGERWEVKERREAKAKREAEKAAYEAAKKVRAAAPDLLAALRDAIDIINANCAPRVAAAARAAIEKAEGR